MVRDPQVRDTSIKMLRIYLSLHTANLSVEILRHTEAKLNYELFNQIPFNELMVKPDLIPWNPESLSHGLETCAITTISDSDTFP